MIQERLRTFIIYLGIPVSQFERECSLPNAYVRNIRQTIMPSRLNSIVSKYPRLNIDWLMTGRGNMLHDTIPTATETAHKIVSK